MGTNWRWCCNHTSLQHNFLFSGSLLRLQNREEQELPIEVAPAGAAIQRRSAHRGLAAQRRGSTRAGDSRKADIGSLHSRSGRPQRSGATFSKELTKSIFL